jgi:hypothetical protein
MEAIFTGLLTNLPNLAGLIILAYVLYRIYEGVLKLYSELLTKYHELVIILAANKQITPNQMRQLLAAADDRADHQRPG